MLRASMLDMLKQLYDEGNFRVRQTVINAAGEIGKKEFGMVASFFDIGLTDPHHSVRNAVIGSVKKMGEVNPIPVLKWAQTNLHHADAEIRREVCHGIELRGRTYPGDILPLLKQLQFDQKPRVRNTLVHVLGQISYKAGCLPIVLADLKTWENKDLVKKGLYEIIDVHRRYHNFCVLSVEEAADLVNREFAHMLPGQSGVRKD
jgi:hypothetical protein